MDNFDDMFLYSSIFEKKDVNSKLSKGPTVNTLCAIYIEVSAKKPSH